ncbi:hypothetical protein AYL99_03572 [Fonsecaea erecta]|uniref:Cytochrome P450 monooxygenase n=1 Tax=Fonsecaea erecta TaxID=1367422 RepID=A0A178ZNH9_9EURO|nr:hypothetical protein AYL99_03572 [Fonsecaea erecta]OAP61369.1 hypothetical protein AYL99_03572 [Fonsecaea erecta]
MLVSSVLPHDISPLFIALLLGSVGAVLLSIRLLYNLYWHPLSKYPGPWYAAATSLSVAVISVLKAEPQWLMSVVRKYGTESPIRISPNVLLFPKPSSLKEIYWDPKCNTKMSLYGTGALGPPHLFTTLDGEEHKNLRKALGGQQWTIGSLKNNWEPRIDDLVRLFIRKMTEKAQTQETVLLSERVAQVEFAADIMTMISFTEPWGFVKNSRDERGILSSWRKGLPLFGFAGRSVSFRKLLAIPGIGEQLLPKATDKDGFGYLMNWADKEVSRREEKLGDGLTSTQPDFLQHCLDARMDGKPLSPVQKRAHVTLLIQAGADTTGTALGATLRFLSLNPDKMKRAWEEVDAADRAGKLSDPVQYEETREHLPFFCACIKEAIRLCPPADNLFGRVVGKSGKVIEGHFLPPGTEITSNAYVVQRDPVLYGPDPEAFRPERWLESKEKAAELELHSFVFGIGPRICLGKDVAIIELHKLLPEIIRRFDIELVTPGRFVVAGGVAYFNDFNVKLIAREEVA